MHEIDQRIVKKYSLYPLINIICLRYTGKRSACCREVITAYIQCIKLCEYTHNYIHCILTQHNGDDTP